MDQRKHPIWLVWFGLRLKKQQSDWKQMMRAFLIAWMFLSKVILSICNTSVSNITNCSPVYGKLYVQLLFNIWWMNDFYTRYFLFSSRVWQVSGGCYQQWHLGPFLQTLDLPLSGTHLFVFPENKQYNPTCTRFNPSGACFQTALLLCRNGTQTPCYSQHSGCDCLEIIHSSISIYFKMCFFCLYFPLIQV